MADPTIPAPPQAPAASPAEERAAAELLARLRTATLGEYDIHGELGRGGMATVYLAHEISLDRKVAIKVMSPAMLHGSGMVERFKREARTAAGLSHPNIIPIYSVREVDGLLFCVIKLVQGTPLDAIMRELGQLPIPMVQGILAQVGGALGYAHRHGVVHRDVKPGNILIDDEGWAVVTDFGIAKATQDTEGLTVTGMAVGTPAYMSPEQASADTITGASDQYSLGIVAYEMLAGRTPFTGSSMMALMYSHFHDEPPSIRLLRDDCPDGLHDAVMRMLRKAPGERFPSMEDAVAAAGAKPLAHDDPTRSQLISIARTGLTHRIVSQAATPRSPIPVRSPARAAAIRVRRNPVALVGGGAALMAAGFLVAKLASSPGEAAPAAATDSATVALPAPAPESTSVGAAKDAPGRAGSTEGRPPNGPASKGSPPLAGRTSESPQAPAAGNTTLSAQVTAAPVLATERSAPPLRAESVAAAQPDTPVSVPAAPPPSSSPAPQPPPVVVTRTPDQSAFISDIIQSYARALAAGDLAAALKIYPLMPDEQREGLQALWGDGGRMATSWTVSDIVITGDAATARVRGTNVVTTRRGPVSRVPVALRARLERRAGNWQLVALIN